MNVKSGLDGDTLTQTYQSISMIACREDPLQPSRSSGQLDASQTVLRGRFRTLSVFNEPYTDLAAYMHELTRLPSPLFIRKPLIFERNTMEAPNKGQTLWPGGEWEWGPSFSAP